MTVRFNFVHFKLLNSPDVKGHIDLCKFSRVKKMQQLPIDNILNDIKAQKVDKHISTTTVMDLREERKMGWKKARGNINYCLQRFEANMAKC